MDYNRIDILDHGTVWQGGTVDAAINESPFLGPLLVICMDAGEQDDLYIDHNTVEAVLAVWINDSPDACLKDAVLMALTDAAISWLNAGGNLYVHCAAGVSRSSYFDVALHCRVLGISATAALSRLQAARPVANPNAGFMAQLERLWP